MSNAILSIYTKKHIAEELINYMVQCLVFFMIMVLSTDFLRNRATLEKYLNEKINNFQDIFSLFFIPIVAIFFVAGLMFFALRVFNSNHEQYEKIDVAMREIPKLLYFIGSSFGILEITISFEVVNKAKTYWNLFGQGCFVIISYFILGCFISYFLKPKTPLNRRDP